MYFPKKQSEKSAENAYLYSCIQSISLMTELSIERRLIFGFYIQTYFFSIAELDPSIISLLLWNCLSILGFCLFPPF